MTEQCYRCHERPRYNRYSYCHECWNHYQRNLKRRYVARSQGKWTPAPDLPLTRKCPCCGVEKPMDEWVTRPRCDGTRAYSWRCIDCKRVYDREYRERNIERIRAYKAAQERERRSLARMKRDISFRRKALAIQALVRRSKSIA